MNMFTATRHIHNAWQTVRSWADVAKMVKMLFPHKLPIQAFYLNEIMFEKKKLFIVVFEVVVLKLKIFTVF